MKYNKSYTLVEVIVSVAVFTVISAVLFMALSAVRQQSYYYKDRFVLINSLGVALKMMNKELKESSFSYLRDADGMALNDDTVYDHIKFKLPYFSSSGDITGWSDWIELIIENNDIIRRDSSGDKVLISGINMVKKTSPSDIGSAFEYDSSQNKLNITLVANKTTVLGKTVQAGVFTSVNLRN